MIIDLRRCNAAVLPTGGGLPDMEMQLAWMDGSENLYGSFDGLSGFDYLRVKEEDRKYFGITTPFGCFKLRSAPQGFVNTPHVFEERIINEILRATGDDPLFGAGCLQWLDDTLLYASSFESYLERLIKLLSRCEMVNYRLNIDKCEVVGREMNWCGRTLAGGKWKFNEKYFLKISKLPKINLLGHLEDIVYVSTWLSSAVPRLAELKSFLSKRMRELTDICKTKLGDKVGRRRRKQFDIDSYWKNEDQTQLDDFLYSIQLASDRNMSFYSRDKEVGIHCDASQSYWCAVLAVYHEDGWLPLYFLSGEFTKSSYHWSMTSKELFPIFKLCRRYQFLLLSHGKDIQVFTDHKNLVYLMSAEQEVKHSTFGRIQRWILALQAFKLKVVHIPGESNTLPDLLTRWGYIESDEKGNDIEINTCSSSDKPWTIVWKGLTFEAEFPDVDTESRFISDLVRRCPSDSDKDTMLLIEDSDADQIAEWRFDPDNIKFIQDRICLLSPARKDKKWELPNVDQLLEAQKSLIVTDDYETRKDGVLIDVSTKKIKLTAEFVERFVVLAHWISSHGSCEASLDVLERYTFEGISKEKLRVLVKKFKIFCMHCDRTAKLIRREYGEISHSTETILVLHTDFLKINDSYLLVIVEDITRKSLLLHTRSPDAQTVFNGLVAWKGYFGLPRNFTLYSDNGSHFANSIVEKFCALYPAGHKFSVGYSPWANGSAESMNKSILLHLRQLCSQYMLPLQEWPSLIPILMAILNNLPSRKGYSPNELSSVFAMRPEIATLEEDLSMEDISSLRVLPICHLGKIKYCKDADAVKSVVGQMREILLDRKLKVLPLIVKHRDTSRKYINEKFRLSDVQFGLGDMVLLSDKGTKKAFNKLLLRWTGPYIVTGIEALNVYVVKDLAGKSEKVHAQRLSLYDGKDSDFVLDSTVSQQFYYHQGPYSVELVLDVRYGADDWEVLVKWRGFLSSQANWQPLLTIYEDAPTKVVRFINNHKNDSDEHEAVYRLVKGWRDEQRSAVIEFMLLEEDTQWKKKQWEIICYPPALMSRSLEVTDGLSRAKGWTDAETRMFQDCVYFYGIGSWEEILKSCALPGKTKSQLVTKVKAMIGAQIIYEYHGLKVPLYLLKEVNDEKKNVFRRHGIIINQDEELTKDRLIELRKKIWSKFKEEHNKKREVKFWTLRPTEVSSAKLSLDDIEGVLRRIDTTKGEVEMCLDNRKMDKSPRLRIKFGEKVLPALLDSGATKSCLGVDNVPEGSEIFKGDSEHQKLPDVKGLKGITVAILGYILVDVLVGGGNKWMKVTKMRLFVLDQQSPRVFLGRDFLAALGICPTQKFWGLLDNTASLPQEDVRRQLLSISPSVSLTLMGEWENLLEKEKNLEEARKRWESATRNRFELKEECLEIQVEHSPNLYRAKFISDQEDQEFTRWVQPVGSLWMKKDVRQVCFKSLGLFNLLLLDPPWNEGKVGRPTRGVTLNYGSLTSDELLDLDIGDCFQEGIIGIWATNSKLPFVLQWMDHLGVKVMEYLVWMKRSCNNKAWSSQGHLLRHSKEILVIGKKGTPRLKKQRHSDVVVAKVREQSRKPDEIYQVLEVLMPNCRRLEIFGKRWNVRQGWYTLGLDTRNQELKNSLTDGVDRKLFEKRSVETGLEQLPKITISDKEKEAKLVASFDDEVKSHQ